MLQLMIKQLLCFTLLMTVSLGISPSSDTPIYPYSTNNGVVTSYVFTANIANDYLDGCELQIIFPNEFKINEGQVCTSYQKQVKYDAMYVKNTCRFGANNVIYFTLNSLSSGVNEFVVEDIANPKYESASKMF